LKLTGAAASAAMLPAAAARKPNVIVILADDIGFGDVGCYGATKVKTPNLDKLASRGLRFTDAHSPAATCTPTRYSIMTGEYAWRKPGTNVLPGDANLTIDTERTTTPSVFKKAGYATGCVGKWHLGLGKGKIDWNGEIKPGPLEIGFDYAFIIPATGDRVPTVYVENHRVVNLDPKDPIEVSYGKKIGDEPTGKERPDLLRMKLSQGHDQTIVNGISRIGYMTGGKSARWDDEKIAETITRKATGFIERSKDKPFFLYFATHDIHVPRVPNDSFRNSSQCGLRCDAIQEFDWSVGQVVETLDRLKLTNDTLLIVTSDNGPVVDDGYADGSVEKLNGHKPAGPLRGGKYSLYEGGTRMPFIARWPGRIKPGVSDALVCQVDFLASFAALTGQSIDTAAGPDSFNILPALLGETKKGRDTLVEQAQGQALRMGDWKLLPRRMQAKKETGPELYNLKSDLGETKNVAADNPKIVDEMTALLEKIKSAGRSRA
jgi:arylsulfatase A-like enzyme